MSGPLGFGAGGGGGDAVREVIAGSGITTSGTATSITVVNDGVRSLSGSGISVSSATGAVTITAPTVSGGTGISVSGSGTTALTVSATGVQSITAGNGISVSGTTTPTITASIAAGTGISISGTTTLSVSATGVQSISAGTGISVSGTTTPTVTNSGVTSIVAGTNVTVSGATGAVTINAPGFATPASSAIGDTAAAGTATTVSRSDHVHGREAAGTPGASAVGDTAAAGVATTVARSDHRHSREAFGTPVNIDASLTSLSTGSLTTVARADHVHTVSKVPVLIASTSTTNATTTSITFSNIPQTYTTLMMYILGYVTNGTDDNAAVDLQFNGDTGANYASMTWSGGNTAVIAGLLHGPANWASTIPAANTVTIHQYRAAYYKYVMAQIMYNSSTTAQNPSGSLNVGGWWKSTAAITSITVKTRGAYYNNGALFSLIGIP